MEQRVKILKKKNIKSDYSLRRNNKQRSSQILVLVDEQFFWLFGGPKLGVLFIDIFIWVEKRDIFRWDSVRKMERWSR